MFVEGFRLCVALLGTGVGFAVGQRLGNGARPSQLALAGILGCLAGYVLGGVGGRFTDRALAVAESREGDQHPCRRMRILPSVLANAGQVAFDVSRVMRRVIERGR